MSKSILICDDSAFTRMMLRDMLIKNGFDVCGEASNGLAAVEKYKELRPDLVFMDIVMPEMGGAKAFCEIRSLNPSAAVIMLGADKERETAEECVRAGAKGFVVKPFRDEAVLAAVKKAVG